MTNHERIKAMSVKVTALYAQSILNNGLIRKQKNEK